MLPSLSCSLSLARDAQPEGQREGAESSRPAYRSDGRKRSILFLVLLFSTGMLVGGCQSEGASSGTAAPQSEQTTEKQEHDEEGEHEHGHGEAELARHMSTLQRWTHKTALSVQARNQRLAEFYLHETEEAVETIQTKAPTYEGYEIKTLTEQMLVPSLDSLDAAVDAADWPVADQRLQTVARSCNQCHAATDHGFVNIKLDALQNPYAQSFAPDDETP